MTLSRRKALFGGLAGLIAAPAIIRTPGLLMPIKPIVPEYGVWAISAASLPDLYERYSISHRTLRRIFFENNGVSDSMVWRAGDQLPMGLKTARFVPAST